MCRERQHRQTNPEGFRFRPRFSFIRVSPHLAKKFFISVLDDDWLIDLSEQHDVRLGAKNKGKDFQLSFSTQHSHLACNSFSVGRMKQACHMTLLQYLLVYFLNFLEISIFQLGIDRLLSEMSL